MAKSSHILVFPYPAQGHMLALLDLTRHLATHGFTLTIVVTPKNLPILNPLLSSFSNIQPLVFPFPPHPSLPNGVENIRDVGTRGNVFMINSLAKLQDPILQWFESHPNPPVAIISDFFLGWTNHLANKLLGIPRICFSSTSAFLHGVFDYACQNISLVRSQDTTVFHDMPGSPSLSWNHFPGLIRAHKDSDPEWDFFFNSLIANSSSWGWVANTFEALEAPYIKYLMQLTGHERVFGVGPISLLEPMARGPSDPEQAAAGSGSDVLTWLDGRPDGSVVYVCFGSQIFLTRSQIEALAIGLEDSGIHYVWVVKPEQGDLVRVGSVRGFVIKGWAPQVAIMSHRAVGGYLSHCGWNSVLEAVLAEVFILAWPMEADHYVNARLLVEEHGVAIRVSEGMDTVPDAAHLARVIAESMSGDKVEKFKVKQLKYKAIEALKEGGSSSIDLDRFVKELSKFQPKKM